MIKYKANHRYDYTIEAVEVESETPKFVTPVNGMREAKETNWHRYFDTWEEAHALLTGQARKRIVSALERVKKEDAILARLQAMKNGTVSS